MLEIRAAIGESVNVFLDVHGCKTIHLWIDTIGGKILGRHVYYWQNGELAYERKASATEVETVKSRYRRVLERTPKGRERLQLWNGKI